MFQITEDTVLISTTFWEPSGLMSVQFGLVGLGASFWSRYVSIWPILLEFSSINLPLFIFFTLCISFHTLIFYSIVNTLMKAETWILSSRHQCGEQIFIALMFQMTEDNVQLLGSKTVAWWDSVQGWLMKDDAWFENRRG